mmetsp:Transcript_266/g.903  ORF Transcript_266/g.903 Transcript_266/m.903 type:complete len:796 (-) Transcript_266:69-2456(-)
MWNENSSQGVIPSSTYQQHRQQRVASRVAANDASNPHVRHTATTSPNGANAGEATYHHQSTNTTNSLPTNKTLTSSKRHHISIEASNVIPSSGILTPAQKYYTKRMVRELQGDALRQRHMESVTTNDENRIGEDDDIDTVLLEPEDISMNGDEDDPGHPFHESRTNQYLQQQGNFYTSTSTHTPVLSPPTPQQPPSSPRLSLSTLFHPIALIGFFLHTFRLILSKVTSIPLLLLSYMTRFYVSLSISVFRNAVFLFKNFLYFGFFWWWWTAFRLSTHFVTRWIMFVWGLIWRNHLWYRLGFKRPISPVAGDGGVAAIQPLDAATTQAPLPNGTKSHRSQRASMSSKSKLPRTKSNASLGSSSQGTTPNKKSYKRATKQSVRSSSQPAKVTTPDKSKAIRDLFHVVPSDRQYKYVVHIPEGRFIPHDKKYRILMKEQQKFSIVLCNDDDTPCCCVILVDGKHVGNVCMEPHSFGSLNRSAYTRRRFVFESKTQQLRRIHSMESISSSSNDFQAAFFNGRSASPQASRHSRNLSQEEPMTPPPRLPQKSTFDIEVIFCPMDRSFWVRYRKLMLGYAIIALLLYRFKHYIPLGILCTYYLLVPALFILTYKFFYKDHQVLVHYVLDSWKLFNQHLRQLLLGEADGPDLKHLDVQQYIGDEDLHFDSNDAVRVKLTLIPMRTHPLMTQNVIQRHKEEHVRLHQRQRTTPTSSLVPVTSSPIRSMMRKTPSQLRRSIKRFISAPLLTMKRTQELPLECWRHILSFLDTNSVEFFKLRFVNYALQNLVDQEVFDEIERMQM